MSVSIAWNKPWSKPLNREDSSHNNSEAVSQVAEYKQRLQRLAAEKSQLQLYADLINKLSLVKGLDNIAYQIVSLLMGTLGGTKIILYFTIDEKWYSMDVFRTKTTLDEAPDGDLLEAMQKRKIVFLDEQKDTHVLEKHQKGPFAEGSTWIIPLNVEDNTLGAIVMEGMFVAHPEMMDQLKPFINYASLVLKGEIENYSDLKHAYDNIKKINKELTKEVEERQRTEEALQESETRVRRTLEAILSPEADIATLELADIIDSEKIQSLMDAFYRLTRIGVGIIDLKGRVLVGCGWQDICTKFHRINTESCRLCKESDLYLSSGVPAGEFKLYRCKNNMWDIVTPIKLGDKHLGNIFLGQFLFDDEAPDYETFRQQARRYGFDEHQYIAALERVPRLNRETVDAAISFYAILAGMIGNLSYSNVKLARSLEKSKQTEEALWESKHFLDTLIDAIPIPVFYKGRDGRYLGCNEAFGAFFGANKEYFLGKTVFDFSPPELAETYHAKDEELFRGGSQQQYEFQIQRPDGTLSDVIFDKAVFTDNKGVVRGLIGTIFDITTRKNIEKKLQEQRELLQRSLDALSHPFYVVNVKDYSVALANKASRFHGYPKKTKCYELTHNRRVPCSGTEHPCTLQEVLNKKGPVVLEHDYIDEDGVEQCVEVHAYPLVNEAGEIVQIIEYCIDISERRKSEKERLRLTAVIEQTADSIVITDKKAVIEYVNPGFERITGYTAAEVIGRNPRFLQSGRHSAQFYQEMWDTLTQAKVWQGHIINKKKDGSIYDEEASITPVLDETGQIINYIAFKRDVTEQKKMEAQLQQSQKMEAIGTLAGGIAHDFNNILAAILGYAELAKHDAPPISSFSEHIDKIIIAGNRAKDLVKQILAISRQAKVEKSIISPQPVVKETLKMLRASIPSTIAIKEIISPDCGPIYADPTQIHQIVMNLCTNAFHAMENEKGTLTVQLREATTLPKELRASGTENSFIELSVCDTGSGISPDIIGNIFDPFFTTKGPGKGTGMGLAIIYRIIIEYGGSITVESDVGKGTAFHLYLPQSRQKTVESVLNIETIPRGKENILFVDDEELLAQMGKDILERLGYHVIARWNSLDALSTFEKGPHDFDMVITDQTMPNLTGTDLAQRMLQIRPDIPIILCTGYSSIIDEQKAKTIGIRGFVQKPLTIEAIAKLMRSIFDNQL
jgi:PAS domain S-box-containing protein